jgi:hypothetical protein
VDLVGLDYFGHVTVAGFPAYVSPSDATLAAVGRLTRLQVFFANTSLGRVDIC